MEVGLPPADYRLFLELFVFVEIRSPPAEFNLTSGLFVFKITEGVEMDSRCWRSDLITLNFQIEFKINMARFDLQQRGININSIPLFKNK